MPEVSIALFTRDLRVCDNPVLCAAAEREHTVPLFVVDQDIASLGYVRPNRARFLTECLADLDAGLRERGGRLVTRRGSAEAQVRKLAAEVDARTVHVARDVSAFARRRERELADGLARDGRELVVHDEVVTAVAPGAVTPANRDHFAVFTPYYRRWLEQPRRPPLEPPRRLELPRMSAEALPGADELCAGSPSPALAPGGERAGRRRLAEWVAEVPRYADDHDAMSVDGTSRLSPYLHFGCLSPVEVLARVGRSRGAEAFARQLAWRDFHHQVLATNPAAARRDYRARGDRWRRSSTDLDAWRAGRTGYPIVDAGMRQLVAEGWMHNRARLIVGSFLCKTLYLDWRAGARHFLDLLVDADVANNQLNWQWVAGTGTDTRPNRVLNPLAQARRYDPDGDYVRRYVPELAAISGADVHQPWRLEPARRKALDYPDPIVDLDDGRRRFLAARHRD